jgi:alkylation response protein AidB-like acyl-CoA dehydrogenase
VGGQGGGLLELALAAEQLGYTAAPGGSWLASVLAAPALAGRPDVSAAVLERGETAAFMIPAGQPPDQPGPVVVKDGGLHGTVRSVLGAGQARHLVVPVWADGECTLYLAAAGEPAIHRAGRKLLDRSRSAADITFTGTPAEPLDADCRAVLADAALRAAVLVAADSLGAADRMLRLAVDYSQQRTQFGAPIGSFQAVKHHLTNALLKIELARPPVYRAAHSLACADPNASTHVSIAKACASDAATFVARVALQCHGAIGYSFEHDLHLWMKRAWALAAAWGDAAWHRARVADAVIDTSLGATP